MTLLDFYDMLAKHDWYYAYSDDNRVYLAGERSRKELMAVAEESVEHADLYRAWNSHMFTGEPWGNEKTPKPERSQYE